MSPLPAFDVLGLPAPLWFLWSLKIFGAWVHVFFMNLWFAGLLVGLVLVGRPDPLGRAGKRLLGGMPVFIAFGVNAGIVPLLFLQVVLPQFFYTTTILQAWVWFAIVPLMLVAYYGTYLYVLARKDGRATVWTDAAGWVAALVFLGIGLVLATEMQLLTRPETWSDVAGATAGGAVAGTAFAVDGTGLLRYAMMFGLALGTTAAWLAFDHHVLAGTSGGKGAIRGRGAPGPVPYLVVGLAGAGLVVFGAAALPYLRTAGPHLEGWRWLRVLAGAGPLLALLAAALYLRHPGRGTALVLFGLQLTSLLFNVGARQVVQAGEVALAFDLGTVPVNTQLSPILLFLGTLVAGAGAMAWLLTVFARAARASPAA